MQRKGESPPHLPSSGSTPPRESSCNMLTGFSSKTHSIPPAGQLSVLAAGAPHPTNDSRRASDAWLQWILYASSTSSFRRGKVLKGLRGGVGLSL